MDGTRRFLLIRHTSHDLIGKAIAGRMPGVHLNRAGRDEADRLAQQLAALPITRVFSGPLERVRETAAPLCERMKLSLQIAPAFDEVETGEWTGLTFQELDARNDWRNWNRFRSNSRCPGGEAMIEVQLRAVGCLSILNAGPGLTAIFSHGDVIRAVVAFFLGVSLDLFLRIDIAPGSISCIDIYDDWAVVKCVNATGADVTRFQT